MSQSPEVTGPEDVKAKEQQAKELIRQTVAAVKPATATEKEQTPTSESTTAAQTTSEQTTTQHTTNELFMVEPPKDQKKAHGVMITAGEVEAAENVLSQIGGGDNIVVVPDDAFMGTMAQDNPAVTIKDSNKIMLFKNQLESFHDQGRYETSLYEKLLKRVGDNTIVIKQKVLGFGGLQLRGTIWHEHGHVKFGAPENGHVFAYELQCLRDQRSDDDARAFVEAHRKNGAYYTDTAVEPGINALQEQMQGLGLTFTRGQKATRTAGRKSPGAKVFGRPGQLKTSLKTGEGLPAEAITGKVSQFDWAGYAWKVNRREILFKIKVVEGKNSGRRQGFEISGNQFQLVGKADTVADPPTLDDVKPNDEFEWAGSRWALVSAEPDFALEVVMDLLNG